MAVLKTFYSACNAVKVNLKVGFICPFVVIDSTNLRATIVVAQAVSLTNRVERKRLKNDERQRLRKCVCVWEGAGERQNEIHYRTETGSGGAKQRGMILDGPIPRLFVHTCLCIDLMNAGMCANMCRRMQIFVRETA